MWLEEPSTLAGHFLFHYHQALGLGFLLKLLFAWLLSVSRLVLPSHNSTCGELVLTALLAHIPSLDLFICSVESCLAHPPLLVPKPPLLLCTSHSAPLILHGFHCRVIAVDIVTNFRPLISARTHIIHSLVTRHHNKWFLVLIVKFFANVIVLSTTQQGWAIVVPWYTRHFPSKGHALLDVWLNSVGSSSSLLWQNLKSSIKRELWLPPFFFFFFWVGFYCFPLFWRASGNWGLLYLCFWQSTKNKDLVIERLSQDMTQGLKLYLSRKTCGLHDETLGLVPSIQTKKEAYKER